MLSVNHRLTRVRAYTLGLRALTRSRAVLTCVAFQRLMAARRYVSEEPLIISRMSRHPGRHRSLPRKWPVGRSMEHRRYSYRNVLRTMASTQWGRNRRRHPVPRTPQYSKIHL